MKRYCGSEDECEKGKQVYYAWLNKLGLDDTKPYRLPQERFSWAKQTLRFVKQDKEAKYYKVEALFPTVSMNHNVYTEDELIRAARTLIGKTVNLNHTDHILQGVEVVDAEYEDGSVEVLLRVPKDLEVNGRKLVDLVDSGEIIHVSIEASCRYVSPSVMDGEVGRKCEGLVFTGLALLTKDTLPGVPLTRIMPAEAIVEAYGEKGLSEEETETGEAEEKAEEVYEENSASETETRKEEGGETEEAEWDTAFINRLPNVAFAVIEPAYLRGETEDKRCRHLPHHGPNVKDPEENSSVDLPHLRNALARMNQIKPFTDSISAEELRSKAKTHLTKHAKALLKTYQEQFTDEEKIAIVLSWLEEVEGKLEDLTGEMAELKEGLAEKSEEPEAKGEVEEEPEEEVTEEGEKEDKEESGREGGAEEEKPAILTREGFWNRFRELRHEGLSKSEAYRLTVFEFLKALEKN